MQICLLVLMLLFAAPSWAASCAELAKLVLPDMTVSTAESVTSGSFTPPGGKPIPNLPAFCRVAGVIRPSSDSEIRIEVWMPASGWNGKFQAIGNGGFAGSIGYGGLAFALNRGYATAATDTGHQAGGTDAGWALGHPEKVIDFGHRAIHQMTVKAKAIIQGFYGEGPKRSYFNSCSNGGRQALMEAQRYPEDYDGIVSGAPANFWTHLLASGAWNMQATLASPGTYIPEAKLPAIQKAALDACDSLDGVPDGAIENPPACRFDPSVLLCKGPESEACLTAPQVAVLKKLYDGPRDSKGRRVFPGYSPGGEAESGGWMPWITGPAPEKSALFAFSTQYYQNIVYQDPAWDYRKFDLDRDIKAAVQKTAHILDATDPDLTRFMKRGGKLILYHGWCDAAIPGQNAIDYYQSVVERMGAQNASSFIRLFMAPGVQHCAGGAGPDSFGQMGGVEGDALHDIDAALERWVEQGVAPEKLIAIKYKTRTNPASGVLRSRPLCAWPRLARWNGTGSTDDAANFTCASPPAGK